MIAVQVKVQVEYIVPSGSLMACSASLGCV